MAALRETVLLDCVCCRLGWPDLLDHPFVRETDTERLVREKALADAMELADSSRGWKVRAAAGTSAVLNVLRSYADECAQEMH
jgi:hypothetical protein